jgi:hypothetical protein
MRSAKRVTLSLLVVLTLLTATTQAGQTNADNRPRAPQGGPAGTQFASCVVKITVDPAVMPLNPETVQALVSSSGVAGKAAQEVLHVDALPNIQEFVEIEWLAQDARPIGESRIQPSAAPSVSNEESQAYDLELMRQMSEIYGAMYTEQFGRTASTGEKKDEAGATRTGAPRGTATQPGPGARGRGRTGLLGSSPYGAPSRPGTFYGGPAEHERERGFEQSATVRLTVHLPPDVTPAARGFLEVLVENLRTTLLDAYAQHVSELNALLRDVESRRRALETGPSETDTSHPEEEQSVQDRLDWVVDLSMLQPAMPVREAVDILRKSVDPPLQIVVLWRDLEQNAEIVPASPIDIDGLGNVRVRTALEVLLKAFGAGRPTLSYQIKGSVITVGTAQTLGGPAQLAAEPRVEADIAALAADKTDLTRTIQALYVDLATQEARQKAIEKQITTITNEAAKRASQDEIARELNNLVKISTVNMAEIKNAIDAGRATPTDMSQAQESLTRAKIELARRREELSKSAGGGQLDAFNKELSQMAVERAGKLAQQSALNEQLANVQRELAQAPAFDPAAARMRIVREALEVMARRMAELQTRLANLQPPTVTMIGAD